MNDINIMNFLDGEKKATAREIAEEMDRSPSDVLNALLRIEAQGKVRQLNGYWSVVVKPKNTE